MDWVVPTAVICPYCFEEILLNVDTCQGDHSTIEDCSVCCRPIEFDVRCCAGEVIDVMPTRG